MSAVVPSRRFRSLAAVLWALAASVALLASAGGAQAQNGLSGIDVSNWQRQIDWIAVAGTGNSFVFAKATEGTTFTDLTFPAQPVGVDGARNALRRVPHGAARRVAPTPPWLRARSAQADYFLSVATPLRESSSPCSTSSTTAGSRSRGYRSGCRHGSARSWPAPASSRSSTSRRTSGRRSSATRRSSRLPGTSSGSRTGRPRRCRSCRERAGADSAGRSGSGATARDPRHHRLRRRRPVQRVEPFERHRSRPTRPGRRPRRPPRRSSAAPQAGQAARRATGNVGRRQAGRVLVPVAALRRGRPRLRRRSRPRRRPRTPPSAADVGHALVVRVSAVTPAGSAVGGLRADPRRRELGGAGWHRTEVEDAARDPGRQPGRADAGGSGRHVDGVADLVLLPVAALRTARHDGVRRDPRRRRRHLHDDARGHRLR